MTSKSDTLKLLPGMAVYLSDDAYVWVAAKVSQVVDSKCSLVTIKSNVSYCL